MAPPRWRFRPCRISSCMLAAKLHSRQTLCCAKKNLQTLKQGRGGDASQPLSVVWRSLALLATTFERRRPCARFQSAQQPDQRRWQIAAAATIPESPVLVRTALLLRAISSPCCRIISARRRIAVSPVGVGHGEAVYCASPETEKSWPRRAPPGLVGSRPSGRHYLARPSKDAFQPVASLSSTDCGVGAACEVASRTVALSAAGPTFLDNQHVDGGRATCWSR